MSNVHYLPRLIVVSAADLWREKLERQRRAKQYPNDIEDLDRIKHEALAREDNTVEAVRVQQPGTTIE